MSTTRRIEPGPFKDFIHCFNTKSRCLGDHEVDINESNEAPCGKEDKGTPIIGLCKERRRAVGHGEHEKPVETLAESRAKRSNAIRPEFATEDVGEDVEAWYLVGMRIRTRYLGNSHTYYISKSMDKDKRNGSGRW